MERFSCLTIAVALHDFAILETALEASIRNTGATVPVDDLNLSLALRDVTEAVKACSPHPGMRAATETARRVVIHLSQPTRAITVGELETEIRNVREAIWAELRREIVISVPQQYGNHVDNENLFGAEVRTAFPAALPDIRDAGNCLAVDLNTAAVFHAMRVAEQGLHWLADKLSVQLTDKGQPMPVTEATWAKVIDGLRKRIGELRQLAASPDKREQLETYARAADHCDYMKDIWRNAVAHAHKSYIASEAATAVERVREFMQLLTRIS